MKNQLAFIGIFLQIPFLLLIQSAPTSDPFYIIAHMVNNRATLDWALEQGANAIQSDFQFNSIGYPISIGGDEFCDCKCAREYDHVCHNVLNMTCSGIYARRNIIEHVEDIASRNRIALYYIDSKLTFEKGDRLTLAGRNIIAFLNNHLFNRGYKGKVLISVAKTSTFDYIQSAVITANNSINKNQYYFTFNDRYNDNKVIEFLSRLTNQRISLNVDWACSLINGASDYYGSIARKSRSEYGLTFAGRFDSENLMVQLINSGIDGIVTNRVGVLRKIVEGYGLTLATSSTPIPFAYRDVPTDYKCGCMILDGGCRISYPSPRGTACQCIKFYPFCLGFLEVCDNSHPKCANPDLSKASCQLANGTCDGY